MATHSWVSGSIRAIRSPPAAHTDPSENTSSNELGSGPRVFDTFPRESSSYTLPLWEPTHSLPSTTSGQPRPNSSSSIVQLGCSCRPRDSWIRATPVPAELGHVHDPVGNREVPHVVERRADLPQDLPRRRGNLDELQRVQVEHPVAAVRPDDLRRCLDLRERDECLLLAGRRRDQGHAGGCGGLRLTAPATAQDRGEQHGQQRDHHHEHAGDDGDTATGGASAAAVALRPLRPLRGAGRRHRWRGRHRVLRRLESQCHRRVGRQIAGRLITLVRGFRHGPGDHIVEGRRQVGAVRGDLRRGLRQMGEHQRRIEVRAVGRVAREHLEQHAAEGVDVGARIGRLSLELLRGRVVERSHELSRPGETAVGRRPPGQAEVGQVDVRVGRLASGGLCDEDVGRLHVPVDEPLGMGGIEGAGHLAEDRERDAGLERAELAHQALEVGSLDVAHGDEQPAVRLPGLVDRDHVRVVE